MILNGKGRRREREYTLADSALVTKLVENGGLAIGNFRAYSEVLLGKWLWWFPRKVNP